MPRGRWAAIGGGWLIPADTRSIARFYDQGQGYLFELMWWHTLVAGHEPLAYVLALDFARQRQSGRRYLDFGAGVGAGGLLFARHGFRVFHADISSTLLRLANGARRDEACRRRSSI
jgi:hypothetical protein